MVQTFNKDLCIFCQLDTGTPTNLAMTLKASNRIPEYSKNYSVMHNRLAGIIDLVASYHLACRDFLFFFRKLQKYNLKAQVTCITFV